ncbi:MAG TPA: hypothetical protein VK993_04605 [Chthoniobacterales bacterium]|nr:hypothetical protein [Chthoniobacterales bacterium]
MNRLKGLIKSDWTEDPCFGGGVEKHREESGDWHFPHSGIGEANVGNSVVDALLRELSSRRRDEDAVYRRLDELEDRVVELDRKFREFFGERELPSGEFESWLEAVAGEAELRGMHVAFKSGIGLVAAARSLDELVRKLDGSQNDVSIGYVPGPTV